MASQVADNKNVTKYSLDCQPGFRQSGMVMKNTTNKGKPMHQKNFQWRPSGGDKTDLSGGSVRQDSSLCLLPLSSPKTIEEKSEKYGNCSYEESGV